MMPETLAARIRAHTEVTGVRSTRRPTRSATDIRRQIKDRKNESGQLSEAARVAALPTWDPAEYATFDISEKYRLPGGYGKLKPIQSVALLWAATVGGLLGPIGVGHGKTLLTLLAGVAVRALRPVLLLPPSMREPFAREHRKFRENWSVHPKLRVVPYSQLSNVSGQDLLTQLNPDLIIADECHNLRHPSATRTKRVLRYFAQFPSTKFIGLSGTITRKGLADYAHLSELALGTGSPLPLDPFDLMSWANCIDSDGRPTRSDWACLAAGGFMMPEEWESLAFDPDEGNEERRDVARARFMRRLTTTRGVVATDSASVGASLLFVQRPLPIPTVLRDTLDEVYATWKRPDGEEIVEALGKYRLDSQLSSGFWYRWVWPNDTPDKEWIEARAAWHRFIRAMLKDNRAGLDAPLLITNAVKAGKLPSGERAWDAWNAQRHKPQPPTETVWISDFAVRDAVEWALERMRADQPGIVWYHDDAIGVALRKAGLPVYMSGSVLPDAEQPEQVAANFVMACSISAFGTGQNLQAWAHNLVMAMPSSASAIEQLIGRTHRQGQTADEVEIHYYAHTKHARKTLRSAARQARYIEQTTGDAQRLGYGTWTNATWEDEEEDKDDAE